MSLLIGGLILMAVPVWCFRNMEAPDPLTPAVAARYLLMCSACLLLSLLARQNPILKWLWPGAFGASVLSIGLLVIVLWWEVKHCASD